MKTKNEKIVKVQTIPAHEVAIKMLETRDLKNLETIVEMYSMDIVIPPSALLVFFNSFKKSIKKNEKEISSSVYLKIEKVMESLRKQYKLPEEDKFLKKVATADINGTEASLFLYKKGDVGNIIKRIGIENVVSASFIDNAGLDSLFTGNISDKFILLLASNYEGMLDMFFINNKSIVCGGFAPYNSIDILIDSFKPSYFVFKKLELKY